MVPDPLAAPSYRALLAVPSIPRVVVSLFLSRTAQAMVRVALLLFALVEFDSPALAGIVTFAGIVPGILASPIAGALLDRHGRVRLIALDYVLAAVAMVAIGGLSLAGRLSPELLIAIATVVSLTAPLSMTGLRSLFPLMVPPHLWERVNAIDANSFAAATMLGAPLAAALMALLGPSAAILALSVPYGLAALVVRRVPDPATGTAPGGRILVSAWQGLQYTWRNPTLRGLGFSASTLMFSSGMVSIVVPLIVLDRLGGSVAVVGIVFGLSGVAAIASVMLFGRIDSRGKEWRLLVLPMLAMAPATALLLVADSSLGTAAPLVAYAALVGSLVFIGLLEGPLDIGLFTIRQRRTDPAWMGRAFAISMAVNFLGFPIGAAVAGVLVATSVDAAIVAGVGACLGAATIAFVMIPRRHPPDSGSGPAWVGLDEGAKRQPEAGRTAG